MPPEGELRPALEQGLDALGITLDGTGIERLLAYVALLEKWNRVYNLTAVRKPRDMLTLHILDSLAVLAHVHGSRILDVGSGAGLPGIPLAIARAQWRITLLDANAKKTRFMRQAVIELGLNNVNVEQARVESYHPGAGFDTVISRAFASIVDFLRGAGGLCVEGGRLLAMKGRHPQEELQDLPAGYRLAAISRLTVPGLSSERHLVEIAKG